MAQILRQDQFGRERAKELGIHRVDALAARDNFADLAVNLRGRRVRVNARSKQRRFRRRVRGKIAFMADAENRVTQADGVSDFGRGRQ